MFALLRHGYFQGSFIQNSYVLECKPTLNVMMLFQSTIHLLAFTFLVCWACMSYLSKRNEYKVWSELINGTSKRVTMTSFWNCRFSSQLICSLTIQFAPIHFFPLFMLYVHVPFSHPCFHICIPCMLACQPCFYVIVVPMFVCSLGTNKYLIDTILLEICIFGKWAISLSLNNHVKLLLCVRVLSMRVYYPWPWKHKTIVDMEFKHIYASGREYWFRVLIYWNKSNFFP